MNLTLASKRYVYRTVSDMLRTSFTASALSLSYATGEKCVNCVFSEMYAVQRARMLCNTCNAYENVPVTLLCIVC